MVTILTYQIHASSEQLTYVKYSYKGDECGTWTCSSKKYGKTFSYFLSNLFSVELYFVSIANL